MRIYDDKINQKDLFKALAENNIDIQSINKKVMSLEEYFLDLVQRDSKMNEGA
ncbi:hypothetical protein D3C77_674570 [compost metagenome]